jgi:cysteine synthase A
MERRVKVGIPSPVGDRMISSSSWWTTGRRALRTVASFDECIGNTPLIRLRGPSRRTGCEIFGKCEFLNPGGSVKDRAALSIIQEAEREGKLKPGGTIVEGTAGNTGIGLASVANSRGYRTVIVIPDTQSQEKKDALRQLGARLVETPARPYKHPNNYQKLSGRLADALGAVWANQFDNVANREAHVATTGPELWEQTCGRIDAFSCAVGTGGTLAGTAQFLREASGGRVKIGLTDPPGASLVRYFRDGELRAEGESITEGIGQGRITGNLEGFKPDFAFEVDDEAALRTTYALLREEGLALGLSSGTNVAGAIEVAEALGPGHVVCTVLCDSAHRCERIRSILSNPRDSRDARGFPSAAHTHTHTHTHHAKCPDCVASTQPPCALAHLLLTPASVRPLQTPPRCSTCRSSKARGYHRPNGCGRLLAASRTTRLCATMSRGRLQR